MFLTGFVGETDKNSENNHYLYTHKNILVKYNDNRVCCLVLFQNVNTLIWMQLNNMIKFDFCFR